MKLTVGDYEISITAKEPGFTSKDATIGALNALCIILDEASTATSPTTHMFLGKEVPRLYRPEKLAKLSNEIFAALDAIGAYDN